MNAEIRQRLVEAAKDVRTREVLTCLYRDHPQGASFEGLKEMLYLHDDFKEDSLKPFADGKVLVLSGGHYRLTSVARQVLDRDPLILMDEFLR